MRNLIHTGGIAAFALAVGFAATASGQFADTRDHTGTVAQYSLSPSGAVEGLILTDGTEVLLPPDAAGALVAAAHPGDTVTVRGRPAGTDQAVIDAVAVVNDATGALAGTGPFSAARPFEAQSTVRRPLHDTDGTLNGALLEDGTIVRLPEGATLRNASSLAAGSPLFVRGYAEESELGRVVMAQEIGANASEATQIAALTPGR